MTSCPEKPSQRDAEGAHATDGYALEQRNQRQATPIGMRGYIPQSRPRCLRPSRSNELRQGTRTDTVRRWAGGSI